MNELIKKNLIAIVSAFSIIASILGGAYAFDERYVRISDYREEQRQYEARTLEDKVFELDFRIAQDGLKAKAIDKALKQRLSGRLEALRRKK